MTAAHEHLMTAAALGVLVFRPAILRGGALYKIDASDPSMIVVLLPDDLTPTERREAWDCADDDVRVILQRRRRAGLQSVTELVGDEVPAEATGTEGASAERVVLRVVT